MQKETFEGEYEYEGERLDKYVSILFPEQSRSFFQKLIKDGNVSVNDKVQKANYRLKTEDLVTVEIPDAVETQILPEDIPLDILYEDDDLLVVNKPKGMVVHPSAGHYSGTLVNAIMYHCKDSLSGINGEIRPGIVHRIDMDTTGSLIVCKNDESHVFIAEQIKELAEESAASAEETRVMLTNSLNQVEIGSNVADQTSQFMDEMIEQLDVVVMEVAKIRQVSDQQAESVKQISQAVEQVSSVVQSNSATSEQVSATSQELSASAEGLDEMISRFQIRK